MARLNEAPIPTESIDTLKRRFTRQNRELAKNNSIQCVRNRALECEISRLRTENLELREEIGRLQNELPTQQFPVDRGTIFAVKDQMEAKLQEIGNLLSELSNIPSAPRRRSSGIVRRELDPSSWKPLEPVAALSGQARRMSGILEESSPHRRRSQHKIQRLSIGEEPSGNTIRIVRLSDHSNESPDIGPPPVAHFECEDPIKFNPPMQSELLAELGTDDDEVLAANLSVNLETRRRRKEGHSRLEGRRSSLFPTEPEQQSQPPRPSAKRKLSAREAEEILKAPAKDEFVFSRRTSTVADVRRDQDDEQRVLQESGSGTNADGTVPILTKDRSERKVLGNKSVNMSPRKVSVTKPIKDDLKKPGAAVKDYSRPSARERRPRESSVNIVPMSMDVLETVDIVIPEDVPQETLAPKTPAADLFSPTPSEPSAAKDDSRDTPPPSGLRAGNMGSSALHGASRPSRRARAAVNYAEPNLISKMRRPTKDLVDAVIIDGKRTSMAAPDTEEKTASRTVANKHEDNAESTWQCLQGNTQSNVVEPTSPLDKKSDHVVRAGMVEEDPRPKPSTSVSTSTSRRAISALMSSATPRVRPLNAASDIAGTTKKMHEMELYDFESSSPADGSKTTTISGAKHSRRHSSVATDAAIQKADSIVIERRRAQKRSDTRDDKDAIVKESGVEAVDVPSSRANGMVGSRRRSMMV